MEWISVEERLPEPWVEVLVYRGADWPVVSCETDTNGNWLHFFNITHWMPLPEPPKEADNDQCR